MRVLFLGDIVGRPGRIAVRDHLAGIREELGLDLVAANSENASGGIGLHPKNARELKSWGVDVQTTGNHVWRYHEVCDFLDEAEWVLRPANYPPGVPGRGLCIARARGAPVAVLNLQGRTFMQDLDCPFRTAEALLNGLDPDVRVVLVDFHAEATSEKKTLLYALSGRVSALAGTHTHVQTADARIFPGGTGYITDAGMSGPRDSVIGMDPGKMVEVFRRRLPVRFGVAGGPVELQGVLLDIDPESGGCERIEAWSRPIPEGSRG